MSDFYLSGVCAQPANYGPLRDADGNARILGPCGDTMEFWVSIDNDTIEDARYTSDGCFNSNTCGSTLALLVRGKRIEEALSITPEDIRTKAKDTAEDTYHCSELAVATFKKAIENWKKSNHNKLRSGKKKEASPKSPIEPRPHLIVSCRDADGKDNALVVVYGGNCSFAPNAVMIGIVPSRYSYTIIKETGCFVVNIPSTAQKELYDYMGSHSGRDGDKFAAINVKSKTGIKVNAPLLLDCPINIECTVTDSIVTGSHEMFIGKIEYVHADAELLNENGTINWSKINLL
ncbi:MAG TPA: flavin reductase [Treponemataceae bacterium]|nr:flavin reductase [Treponemataceae bacterium]